MVGPSIVILVHYPARISKFFVRLHHGLARSLEEAARLEAVGSHFRNAIRPTKFHVLQRQGKGHQP